MLIAVLAAMKSGAAYVPLDPAYPRERLRFITEDCGMSMLVTEEGLRDTSPLEASKVICIDERRRQVEQEPSSEPDWTVKPSDLAYVIYTSGSSGKPKGVAIEHHSLANFLTSMLREPGFTSADTLLAVTTLSFDIAGLELYLPLVAGGQVVIATREQASDGLLLQHLMASSGATVMQATPATWGMLLQSGWTGKQDLKILCGGESLPRELAAELVPRCHELWNMYGPTETTIWSSTYKVKEMNWSTALIGQPINNTQMYVLDTDKQLVPVGVAGELYIGGEGLARGYLNNPEEAAKRFIPDPFSGRPNARLYATGDMARYLADGNIQYLGRADTQVKVRGFRIELAEIESVLAQYPGLRQAVAVVQQTPGDAQIVAYMVGHGQMSPDVSDIRNFIAQSLPEYMLPSFFVWLDHLPLTPNGKVDRRALPIPSREIGPEKCELPGDELEQQLLGIFGSVLGLQSAGVTDDFFRLGGHSLTAGQLIARVRNSFGVELPVRAVFEKPTVRSLAVEIRRAQVTGEKMRTPALHKRARAQAAPDSREELVKQLDSLPQHDAQSLLRRVLDSKQCL
jgi:amino acid adenylation domain-containing protein